MALRPALFGLAMTTCCTMFDAATADAQSVIANFGNKFMRTYSQNGVDEVPSITHPLERAPNGFMMLGLQHPGQFSQSLALRTGADGAITWSKTYDDNNPNKYIGYDVCPIGIGHFAIAGYRECQIPVSNNKYCEAVRGDMVVTRIDGLGNVVWTRAYGENTFKEIPSAIIKTKDNGLMVAGYKVDNEPEQEGDVYLLKLRGDGSVEWTKHYNNFQWNYISYDVRQTSDDGYITVGRFKRNGDQTAFIFKVSSNGTPEWFREIGAANSYDAFYSVEITSSGDYIASGERGGNMYIAKINANGTLAWAKSYNGGTRDIAYDIKKDGNNAFVVGGEVNGSRACLMRIDANGAVQWAKTYLPTGSSATSARSVLVMGLGYAISGHSTSANSDLLLVKTDQNGDAGCNTSNVSLTTTNLGDGLASITMQTMTNDAEKSDVTGPTNVAKTSTLYCYANVDWPMEEAQLGDLTYAHHGGLSQGGGLTSDPTSEPATLDGTAWTSEAIWVRTNPDEVLTDRPVGVRYANELAHQRPTFNKRINYVYVLIENVGSVPTSPGSVAVHWSVSSSNLAWPANWTDESGEGLSGMVGATVVPSIPAGESYVAEIPWHNPSAADFGGITPDISFLARYGSPNDPMTFDEGSSTEENVINNNNIIWRNDIIVNEKDMLPGNADGRKYIIIRNTQEEDQTASLVFSIPEWERDISPVADMINVTVDLGQELFDRWMLEGSPGENVEPTEDGRVLLGSPDAVIAGLPLTGGEQFPVAIQFESTDAILPFRQYYHYEVRQEGGNGGVTFQLQFPVGDGALKPAVPAHQGNAVMAGIMLNAHPNPSSSTTTASFHLPEPMQARLAIYAMNGKLVRVLVPESQMKAGMHSAEWDGADAAGAPVANGVYIYRLETPAGVASRQIRIVR